MFVKFRVLAGQSEQQSAVQRAAHDAVVGSISVFGRQTLGSAFSDIC